MPVQPACLTKVEIRIAKTDSKADVDYKNLLSNQLSWCNSHRDIILRQAEKLYHTITGGKAWGNLAGRCDFSLDEKLCSEFGRRIRLFEKAQSREHDI